ncbi:MAG: single-stranded DNA-binding protein [Patescibacteria group bacterium]
MYLNKAFVIGNLTRDPELKALPSGIKVCTLSLATNRVWKDKNGARQESADYHNVVVFGKQAETAAQYLKKGSGAMVEGRMQTRSWDGADGQKRYRTEIVADRIQFGNRPQGNQGGAAGAASGAGAASKGSKTSKDEFADEPAGMPDAKGDAIEYPEEEINPEEIPF